MLLAQEEPEGPGLQELDSLVARWERFPAPGGSLAQVVLPVLLVRWPGMEELAVPR